MQSNHLDVLFIVLCGLSGAGLSLQAVLNSKLGKTVQQSGFAATFSFALGTVLLFIYWTGDSRGYREGDYRHLQRVPWWAWCGGSLGAFYVLITLISVSKLGAATVLSSVVCGQLIASVLLDHFAVLGLAERSATPLRIVGACLAVAGAVLIGVF